MHSADQAISQMEPMCLGHFVTVSSDPRQVHDLCRKMADDQVSLLDVWNEVELTNPTIHSHIYCHELTVIAPLFNHANTNPEPAQPSCYILHSNKGVGSSLLPVWNLSLGEDIRKADCRESCRTRRRNCAGRGGDSRSLPPGTPVGAESAAWSQTCPPGSTGRDRDSQPLQHGE